ncbi:MAG: DUF2934 domain-containing protein [Methylococcaceae bacterium]|nr:DUF2934 domain-containing protein [Methylococcaceae bacterium]
MLNKLITATTLHQFNWSWPTFEPETLALLILIMVFGLLAALEQHAPKTKVPRKQLQQSYKANFSLFLFNSLVMSILTATSLLIVAKHPLLDQGLLSLVANPVVKTILAFLSLDLLLYGWHNACHRFDGLWMFHKVHHNDPYLNVSTGFRLHIIELLITHLLKALLIIIMGIDELIVLVCEAATTLFIMLHHTNTSFKGEKWLGLFFITPDLHRTHHSVERSEHDNNYGAVLSIWDRLFGSFAEMEPEKIGIKGESPLDFINLVKFGFITPSLPGTQTSDIHLETMIAEAAYYIAEKRNFRPGQDLNDWLEAKRQIIRMVYNDRKLQKSTKNNHQRGYFDWLHSPLQLNFKH